MKADNPEPTSSWRGSWEPAFHKSVLLLCAVFLAMMATLSLPGRHGYVKEVW